MRRRRPWWLDYLFDKYLWYRRFCGGHWECWWLQGPIWGSYWYQTDGSRTRPPMARHIEKIEVHSGPMSVLLPCDPPGGNGQEVTP